MAKRMKTIRIIFLTFAFIVLIVGLFFSYLIAQLEDAPGVVILGSAVSLFGFAILWGLGELIAATMHNSEMLMELKDTLEYEQENDDHEES
ncbi:hypothetical protein AOC36_11285 [Erysipelothrix larvae]|uniref:Uncharacterized protein n=1 Tax=Erysipelothrix larvae TaxID=1514105 RepID=A0A109UHP4_9FIRM|nr:hypothetical protein [Erysipelothrix larvae]AMC94533.1 hypothetical protein AOC36_11285 [Erysipelothrix larvae]